jgi:hypothetical protein
LNQADGLLLKLAVITTRALAAVGLHRVVSFYFGKPLTAKSKKPYYFYLDDAEWGECFIKVCSYAPWGLKVYLNGHEWLKGQLAKEGIGFEALDNGFLSCAKPERLQGLADSLGPEQVQSFLSKWLERPGKAA